MAEPERQIEESSGETVLNLHGFEVLLDLLGPNRAEAAERYRQIHLRLTRLYEWRGCSSPEELADETFDRVTAKLKTGVEIRNAEHYIIRVAGFIYKETVRREIRQRKVLENEGAIAPSPWEQGEDGADHGESRRICFKDCLKGLADGQRGHLLRYYAGEQGLKIKTRSRLAKELDLASGALRIRMFRLRQRLEGCVMSCMEQGKVE
jgi:DNA-directed RNA polymerase specialized sigma24 family protein